MADSDISTTSRSRSRTSTSTSRSRTGSSSTFRSTASSSNAETETFAPSNSPTATGLLTASVPVQTESTTSLAAPTSTPTSTASDNGGGANPPVAAIAVSTVLGVLVIGAVAYFLIFRRRRRGGSPYITRHEPKRRDTHPQPTIDVHESSLYLASKERENEKEESPMSPSSSSLDSDTVRSPKSRVRTSRASSSIFIDDRDDVTISSRSNQFRPLSFGEPLTSRGLQSAPSATAAQTPLFDRFNSNRVDPERQLPTIPGTPATPRFAFFTPEEQDGEALIAQAPPAQPIVLSRTSTRNSNRSSRSSRSKTRNSTPPTPTSSLPPSPPPPIPLPPLPTPSDDPSKRVSTSTLTAPSRPGFGDSRPVSMQSAYSVQTQNLTPTYSGALSPDILATLERLKKRISTPWSINSVDTGRFSKTTAALTEEA